MKAGETPRKRGKYSYGNLMPRISLNKTNIKRNSNERLNSSTFLSYEKTRNREIRRVTRKKICGLNRKSLMTMPRRRSVCLFTPAFTRKHADLLSVFNIANNVPESDSKKILS